MSGRSICRRGAAVPAVILGVIIAACAGPDRPTGAAAASEPTVRAGADNPNSAAGDAKAFIMGWLDGQTVHLRYTRLYFCEEPPASAAPSECEVGAGAEVFPRGGPIPKIYALAPVGFSPDPATVACPAGTVCPNHPATLDLSRVGGPAVAPAAAHSHIIADRQAGWHQTVNIRVTSLAVWNEIASAKSLAKVRELQAAGRLGPDTPTNIFFFFQVH